MTNSELIIYLLVFALNVLWSSIALNRQSITFGFLSGIGWFVFAIQHLILFYNSSFLVICWLYFGTGAIFFIWSFILAFKTFLQAKKERDLELI